MLKAHLSTLTAGDCCSCRARRLR